jgi:magnesium chelatase family protein
MNSEMSSRDLKELLFIESSAKEIMKSAMRTLSLSARSFNKVLKVSRTIADLEGSATVKDAHILEAIQYRPKTVE